MISGKTGAGIRYALKRAGSDVAYCALSISCGTRSEKGFHNGIAHFIEHCLFKGTTKKTASVISSYLDRSGGELNAFTTKEEIVLHATVLKEDLRKACSLLMEIASSATFPEKEIDTERGVIIDEIQSYKDSPSEDIYDRFEEKLFQGHPLSMPILGSVKSVKEITSGELKKFTEKEFVPWNMAFTVVADIDEKKLEQSVLGLFDKYFTAQDLSKSTLRPSEESGLAVLDNVFNERILKKNHEANAIVGGYAPSLYEKRERFATILMSNILGGPASNSILNKVLREKNGWVYGVESAYTPYSDTGILAISLGCEKENLEKCIAAIKKEILKLQSFDLSERQMKAARKQLLGQLAISSDNGESQCISMGKSLLAYGYVSTPEETRNQIDDIHAEEVRNAACRIFAPGKTSSLVII